LALLRLVAVVVAQVHPRCGPLCHAVWTKLGSKRRRWERMSALCDDSARDSMRQRFAALGYGLKKTAPVVEWDAS
jgi:hypothetical protein